MMRNRRRERTRTSARHLLWRLVVATHIETGLFEWLQRSASISNNTHLIMFSEAIKAVFPSTMDLMRMDEATFKEAHSFFLL